MATLYDKSGKPVEVPDSQLTQALTSGQYLTDKAQTHVTAGGKVYSVPSANLGGFIADQPGARVMSDAEVAAHQQQKQEAALQEKYGGLGSQAKVAGVSALGGLTLGASDLALGAVLSKEQKETLEKERAANKGTDIAAGIVGALAPTILSGGAAAPEEAALLGGREAFTLGKVGLEASELAKGGEQALSGASRIKQALGATRDVVTAPTRALDSLSAFAEKGAAHLVGENAESFAGQLAQKAITKMAGGVVTGGLATGAMDIGEDALSPNHDLTGEQLLQHMALGGLLGGGLGFAGGAGSKLLEKGAEKVTGSGIGDWLAEKAEERQWFATGAKTPETRELQRNGLTPREVGRWSLDNLAKYTEDGKAPLTREAIGEAAGRAVEETGPRVGQTVDKLDAMGAKPEWKPILDRLRSEVVTPLESRLDPGMQSVAKRVSGMIDNVEARAGGEPTFRQLFDLRREIQGEIKYGTLDEAQKTANSAFKNVRNTLEDEIGTQGERAMGPEWGKEYQAVKRDYRMAVSLKDAAEGAEARVASHNPISLESSIIGAHGITGLALGHPMALVAAGGAAVARHLLKTYGDAVGSRVLNALVQSGTLNSTVAANVAARSVVAAQKSYSSAVTRGLSAITRGAVIAAEPGRPRTIDGDFNRKSAQVQAMLQQPQSHAQSIADNAQALGQNFATTGSAYQRAAMSSSVYLAQALPKAKPINPASPKAGMIEPSQAEKERFNRVFDAVHEPTGLLSEAAKGTLTRDQIDAVANTHPATLKDLQKKVTEEMKTLKEPLDPAQAAAVKMLMGEPVFDHPLPPPPQPQAQQPQGGGKKPKSATSRPIKLNVSATGLVGSRLSS